MQDLNISDKTLKQTNLQHQVVWFLFPQSCRMNVIYRIWWRVAKGQLQCMVHWYNWWQWQPIIKAQSIILELVKLIVQLVLCNSKFIITNISNSNLYRSNLYNLNIYFWIQTSFIWTSIVWASKSKIKII